VRNYLDVPWCEVGHLGLTCLALGFDALVDVAGRVDLRNVGITVSWSWVFAGLRTSWVVL
jgi:hypothetical protein